MRLAIFDLDNTLLAGDSDHAWGEYLIAKGLVNAASHGAQNDRFYQHYTQGRLDIHEYVRFTLGPVLNLTLAELEKLHEEFMEAYVQPMILPAAIELVRTHRNQGDYCMIMSATNTFITRPIADALQVHELLATDLVVRDGRYSGEIEGIPCFQHGKVERLVQWVKERNDRYNISEGVFYSDSYNDLPLLQSVGEPVAVDPDERLRAHASAHDWRIISLRDHLK